MTMVKSGLFLNMCIAFNVCVLLLISPIASFSHGAPEFSCKDPSTFHTRRINSTHEGIIMPKDVASNPYIVRVDKERYQPGEKITVIIESTQPDKPIRGFFLQAIQADIHIRDLRRRAFGTFENTTTDEHPSSCQTFGDVSTGGITHSTSRNRQQVTVTWIAPTTHNPGDVQFMATGVLDYFIYWTDIRSPKLVPEGYPSTSTNLISGRFTPTAAWYRWLQYIRQQQLIKQHLGIPITVSEEAGHDHHHHDHHHHDHAHDHAHNSISSGQESSTTASTASLTAVTSSTATASIPQSNETTTLPLI